METYETMLRINFVNRLPSGSIAIDELKNAIRNRLESDQNMFRKWKTRPSNISNSKEIEIKEESMVLKKWMRYLWVLSPLTIVKMFKKNRDTCIDRTVLKFKLWLHNSRSFI